MTARERMVRVVAEALEGHQPVGYDLDECLCGDMFVAYEDRTTHQAEAVVAAMEAQMGLTTQTESLASVLPRESGSLQRHTRLVTDWVSGEGDGE